MLCNPLFGIIMCNFVCMYRSYLYAKWMRYRAIFCLTVGLCFIALAIILFVSEGEKGGGRVGVRGLEHTLLWRAYSRNPLLMGLEQENAQTQSHVNGSHTGVLSCSCIFKNSSFFRQGSNHTLPTLSSSPMCLCKLFLTCPGGGVKNLADFLKEPRAVRSN